MDSTFTIYNASAGSGKTYTIVKEYLKIVLSSKSPTKYQNILAITFTNKAAGEMKERIFKQLKDFSNIKPGDKIPDLLLDIEKDLKIDREKLIERSRNVSSRILHDYSKFGISTIDKFTHKIIRTFSHDLDLPMNFEVEMNTENILSEAIDILISKIGLDEKLTQTLIDFSIENYKDGKSWDLSYGLKDSSKELFKEESLESLKKIKEFSLDDFNEAISTLKKYISEENEKLKTIGTSAMEIIDGIGVEHSFYSRSATPNYFKKIALAQVPDSRTNVDNHFIKDQRLYAKSKAKNAEAVLVDGIFESLLDLYLQSKKWIEENGAQVSLARILLASIKSISLLNELESEIENIKLQNNVLFSAEFNKMIAAEIKDQPIPYIYERIGEKYDYFFIDEFQDTSVLQWQNLLPLIENSLASGGNCFIVGDGKQAIYRWRGGKAEQFIDIYRKDVDFTADINSLTLPKNYRSFKHIVEFSNEMFSFNASRFSNESYSHMYLEGSKQAYNKNEEGYIEIEFLEKAKKEELNEVYCAKTLERINNLIEEGYNLKDIAILTRNRSEGVILSNYLLENNIDVISKESLLLKNNEAVDFCIQTLRIVDSKNDYNARLKALDFLIEKELVNSKIEDKHNIYDSMLRLEAKSFFNKLKIFGLDFDLDKFLKLPLYDALEYLIRVFSLNKENKLELQYFMDFVLEYSSKKNQGMDSFLETWEDKKDGISLVLADGLDAVQIMTIHKSKGLEFPIVLLPYADWELKLKDEKRWVNTSGLDYNIKIDKALLPISRSLLEIPSAESIYNEVHDENKLDNMNLMYVAVTRAVQRVYIIAKDSEANASSFFSSFLNSPGKYLQENMKIEDGKYKIGSEIFVPSEEKSTSNNVYSLKEFDSNNWEERISLSFEAPNFWEIDKITDSEYGNIVHRVLSDIEYKKDVDNALEKLELEGSINSQIKVEIEKLVNLLCNHPELEKYFGEEFEIKNEHDIIFGGEILRPDRVAISNNNAVVIDYKTGSPKEEHAEQINKYSLALKELGYTVDKSLLVYVAKDDVKVLSV